MTSLINKQTQAFLSGLGDEWFERNRYDLGKLDDVSNLIELMKIQPKCVLEVGCANGWRLKKLKQRYGCATLGLDPSSQAIKEAGDPESFRVGTADSIPTEDNTFDIVILGFCLWCIDPNDWLKIVAETTRVLKDGGHLIIHDHLSGRSLKRFYAYHAETKQPTFTYAMDWPSLWLAHPGYKSAGERIKVRPNATEVVSALYKDFSNSAIMLNE